MPKYNYHYTPVNTLRSIRSDYMELVERMDKDVKSIKKDEEIDTILDKVQVIDKVLRIKNSYKGARNV